MNPSLLFHFFIFFTLFTSKAFSLSTSYSDNCNSYVPEANPTDSLFTRFWFLEPVYTNYTGGQNILDQDPQSQWSVSFESTRNVFTTNVAGTYKIQARLSFYPSSIYYLPSNFSNNGSNYSRTGWKHRHRMLVFNLDGFWSTNKLCMVGSARWFTKEGNPITLNAVLKLKLARFMTFNTSLVSGMLESLASPKDLDFFDPISILGFTWAPQLSYNYTLVSNKDCNVTKTETVQDSVISMKSVELCSIFRQRFTTYKLEYPSNCNNCSLFGQDHNSYLPTFVSLYVIQCSREDKKLRVLIEFHDRRFTPYGQSFRPDMSLIGEGTWNETKDELCIVACRILNQSDPLGMARVGDCSIRLTLWFPAVRSIMKTHTTEGQIWTTTFKDDLGSFRMAKFQSFDNSQENYGSKYEYTQMEKVRRNCPKKKLKHVGATHQFGYYGFDMLVKHKNMVSRGFADPISTRSWGFSEYTIVNRDFSQWQEAEAPAVVVSTTKHSGPVNISFEISFLLNISSSTSSGISSLNLSSTDDYRVEIFAEGVYDDETGQICMVGCRKLNKTTSFDCEILVKLQLQQGNRNVNGSSIKGSIESLREKSDVLYFEKLDVVSLSFTEAEARESIWRMDLEIIMVLISDTLMCVFIGRQLFHLKKMPEMVNFTSVSMMLILTLGHMVPLVLNFEAIFSNSRNQQNVPTGSNGWAEVNEVIVRIATMVAFILQSRLLQLTWIAKKNHWVHEIRTLFICLPTYIISGLVMLLVNSKNNNYYTISSQRSVWGSLRSYAGLTLDGFLFPQLILNIFQISKGNALSHWFYIGTTFVRLLPHVYDLYRGQRYISHQFDKLYIYANPRADFYSPAWDIAIVCGGFVFAVIVFLQQCFGGRFMFPKRFQKHVEYEMVPNDTEKQANSSIRRGIGMKRRMSLMSNISSFNGSSVTTAIVERDMGILLFYSIFKTDRGFSFITLIHLQYIQEGLYYHIINNQFNIPHM